MIELRAVSKIFRTDIVETHHRGADADRNYSDDQSCDERILPDA